MANVSVILRTDRSPNSENEYPLQVRVYHNRKRIFPYSFGITLKEKDWNKRTQLVRQSHRLADKINPLINRTLETIEDIVFECISIDRNISSKRLREKIVNALTADSHDFISYATNYYNHLYEQKQTRYANKMKHTVLKLSEYCNGELPFEEIKASNGGLKFLREYNKYLITKKKNSQNTIYGNFKNLKTILKNAISDELFPLNENPFYVFSVKQTDTKKPHLTYEEVKSISDLDLTRGSRIDITRDTFLFSFYMAGIRITDLMCLTWNNVKESGEGFVLEYTMNKTGTTRSLPIIDPALEILMKYRSKVLGFNGYIFPWIDDEIYPSQEIDKFSPEKLKKFVKHCSAKTALSNKYLKEIGKLIGTSKKISNHIARHTFTSVAEDIGELSVSELQSLLGHSSIKTTDVYRENFTSAKDRDSLNKFFRNINEKKNASNG